MKILDVRENLPLVIEIVDTEDNIKAFLPILNSMMPSGLVTLEKVQVLQYGEHVKHRRPERMSDRRTPNCVRAIGRAGWWRSTATTDRSLA